MKLIYTAVLLSIFCNSINASTFEIKSIRKIKARAYVDNSWKNGVPCFKADIISGEDQATDSLTVKAYIYSKGKKLLETLDDPTSISPGKDTYKLPVSFKQKKKYNVYFGVSQLYRKGKDKFKYVVVVFGKDGDYAAKVYPRAKLDEFEFDEKGEISSLAK